MTDQFNTVPESEFSVQPEKSLNLDEINRYRGIHFKFFFYILSGFTLLMIVLTASFIINQRELIVNNMENQAENISRLFSIAAMDAIIKTDYPVLDSLVKDLARHNNNIIMIEVFDYDMMCLASVAGIRQREFLADSDHSLFKSSAGQMITDRHLDDGYIDTIISLKAGAASRGYLRIRFSTEILRERFMQSLVVAANLFIIAVILGIIFAAILSNLIIRPVKQLVQGARQVISGDLEHKIPVLYKDETGLIAVAFNQLTANLTSTIKDIQRYSKHLEETNQALDKKISEMRSLQDLGKIISSIFNLEELLRAIIQNASIVMKSRRCSVVLISERTNNFFIKVAKGFDDDPENLVENIKLKSGGLVTDYVIKTRQPILVEDLFNDERFPELVRPKKTSKSEKYASTSFISVPLIINDKVIGVISVTDKLNEEPFNYSDLALLSIFANQVVIAIENARLYERLIERERLEKELEVARNIQMNMLPKTYPVMANIGIAGRSIPAKEVGGDYYDFIPIDQNKVGIAIGDVAGKGVPAALMMVMIRSILRTQILTHKNPKDVIRELNRLIFGEMSSNMFITLFYTSLDVDEKELTFTNAGHNFPIVLKAGLNEFKSLEEGGLLVGILEDVDYKQSSYKMDEGDIVVFYTDGITEAMNEENDMYGLERLFEVIRNNRNQTAVELEEIIVRDVHEFVGEAPQFDDITLIVVKYEGGA